MSAPVRVALLGFSNFERTALAACFRLTGARSPPYAQVTDPDDAQVLVADADHAPSVRLVQVTERVADTVFIGAQPPEGARAWMARPIDPLHVMRELDAMAAAGALPQELVLRAVLSAPVPAPRPRPAHAPAPAPAAIPLASPAPTGRRKSAPAVAQPGRRTLLVDDSAIATLFLQKCLMPFGLGIETAPNSSRATLLMSQQRFDFIFLDVELGEDSPLDGLALCQQIRRHPVHAGEQAPVVVMVSAHHRELDRVRGTLAGCDAYLAKPLKAADLDKLMRRHGLKPSAPVQSVQPPQTAQPVLKERAAAD